MTFNQTEPRLLSIGDIKEGETWQETVQITDDMVQSFATLMHDDAPAHSDHNHAIKMNYDRPIAHGFLVGSGYSGILGKYLPGSNTVIHKISIEMRLPVYINDRISYKVGVTRIIPAVHSVLLDLSATNQDGLLVNKGSATCLFRV